MDGWKNILGHAEIIEKLKKFSAEKNFPHAIIFSGIEGIGKRKTAEIFAASLLCENLRDDGEPCGICSSCKLMNGKSHPDFYVVEPEVTKTTKNIKIGQIRTLQSQTALKPVQSDIRVVIIDGAEFLKKEAANCLLKTLEEPMSRTVFILITANKAGLLMTVRSRCVTINFERLKDEDIKSELLRREIESERAEKISIISGGSLGRAVKLSESGGYEMRESALDLIERIFRAEMSNEDIFTKGGQITDWTKEQFSDFVIYIQKILRDIFLLDTATLYNPDLKERLEQIKFSDQKIIEMVKIGVETHKRLKSNANLRLLSESYFLQLKKLVVSN
ncbi:MAG: DNA polymerase III subunit delta' [Selenomonadaceae bacterium]|nr:DNA polymerase III subunit delta' [Selenomonadaceae bacterium]